MSRIFLVALFLSVSVSAFSWGLTGHRIVAEIAQMNLKKSAQKELKKIIGKETLAWWSNWPDFIKSDTTWKHAEPWHYVNVKPGLSKEDFIAALKELPGKNLYSQLYETMAQVKDRSLSQEQRQVALRFLIHLVGDLHQPLHVGHADDLGGNRIVVYWFDRKTNLHSLWDTWLLDNQQYSYTEYARLLNIASEEQMKAWSAGTIEDWLYESHLMAEQIYASAKMEEKLGYQYNFRYVKMMEEQLLKGGVRLATLLNRVL
ncbi:MAG: S1/P1 nuclease [Chitinophagaceae bacterium]|nr:S1/P1 nuclease [Chitinophagaceae bacterium]